LSHVSANDRTILAMLSRYPDMPREEFETYVKRIDDQENAAVGQALVGLLNKEELSFSARRVFEYFQDWADNRTERTKQEQWSARRREKETRLALRLNELHAKGVVSQETLLLYGISGELPDVDAYRRLNQEEKQLLWRERTEARFGPQANTSFLVPLIATSKLANNWRFEGF
jgi:hypothetical protein